MTRRPLTSLRGKIHVKHGFPFKGEHFKSSGTYVVLTPGNFHEGGGFKRNEQKDKFYDEAFPEDYLMKKGEILVAMTEQTDGLLGSMAIVPESDRFLHNQRLGLVTALTSDVDTEFIYHLFKTRSVREQLRLSASGSKVKHTSPDRIYDVQVPLPSRREQSAIASLLSTIDEKIEINHRINGELEGIAKLLYDYWFVQFDFPMSAAQAAALGKPRLAGQPYQSSGGKMTHHPDLKREIPDGWSCSTLGEIFNLYQPQTITEKDLKADGDYFVYGANGIVGKYDRFNHEASKIALTCRGSTCGNLTRTVPFSWITGNAMVMDPKDSTLDIEYIYNVAKASGIDAIITGSGQPQITRNNLEGVRTILPDSSTVKSYQDFAEPITKQRFVLELQNQHLTSLRDWLLPMLMNGQVTVR